MNININRQFGISYVEVLIASVLIAMSLVPALDALQTGIKGAQISEQRMDQQYLLLAKMESVLSEPFETLLAAALAAGNQATATSFSDAGGTPNRRIVYLSAYDADNADADNDPFTGTDARLLWVKVEIEDSINALTTLTYQQ